MINADYWDSIDRFFDCIHSEYDESYDGKEEYRYYECEVDRHYDCPEECVKCKDFKKAKK